jgi:hypothetical protein
VESITYDISLSLIAFREDKKFILFCPALDLSGYGDTEKEAEDSFRVALKEFFRYTTENKTLESELSKMGWLLPDGDSDELIPPGISQLLELNDDFNRIFNEYDFRKFDRKVTFPGF